MQGKLIAVVILCVHIETSSLWVEFVKKNKCISVSLVSEEVKSIKFDNFDNSYNSFLWPEYFIDFFNVKDGSHVRRNIRLVFALPPRDGTLQYKRCVHFWNNFPCITSLGTVANRDCNCLNRGSLENLWRVPLKKPFLSLLMIQQALMSIVFCCSKCQIYKSVKIIIKILKIFFFYFV